MRHLNMLFASFLYTGFFPFAPATFATAVFLALYWLVPGGHWMAHWAVLIVTAVLSVPASTAMEARYGKDPHCVVIDEVVGIQLALVGSAPSLYGVVAAFVLFRIFDVWKPFPIYRLQSLPGGWGIVVDDALAGVYTRVVLMVAAGFTPALGTFL
ncbi:MAG: phosphatidylglycerophosphatase A [Candidatus Krumholzibacteria bacterium]|nr:phosphatidylglycerophosphatase A [Candidatus Krumholzibacteria bacterium]MDH4337294.1 phosphatidylglycerophosphatase A [Candidatus Krumholzibacteria bacterium]MDH5269993.1 phosphatidylglycerophosphatase A [Candidatus Krumholzibacteria bacterium]MDH5627331.1 phosphatidylglycerophosphatase A [Candidatus Krumholzibacteria bacterium]